MRILLAILLFAFSVSAQGIGGKAGFGGKAGIGGGAVASVTPVAFDNFCSAGFAVSAVTGSCNLTIGGGVNNGAVAVLLSYYVAAGTPTGITCTVGGVSASLVASTTATTSAARSLVYGLATGSTTGSQSVSCSWTTATSFVIGAMSFSQVNQTTPFAHGNTATVTAAGAISVAVTSATSDYTLTVGCGLNNNSLTAPTQTSKYSTNDASFENQGAGQVAIGAASVTHQWTCAGNCTISGVDVQHL